MADMPHRLGSLTSNKEIPAGFPPAGIKEWQESLPSQSTAKER